MTMNIDWTLRRDGDGWTIYRDGQPDDGGPGTPISLIGILHHLRREQRPIIDLPDVGVASSDVATNQERCVLTGLRIRNAAFGTILDGRAKPPWQACVFGPGGARWYLHAAGAELVAPSIGAAIASLVNLRPRPHPSNAGQWRRGTALNLLARAFTLSGGAGPLVSAWCAATAIGLLTHEAWDAEAHLVESPRDASPARPVT